MDTGYRTLAVVSERPSAFSYEDIYSDLLGITAAADALREAPDATAEQFSRLMQINFNRMIGLLQPVAGQEALRAVDSIEGKWWSSQRHWPDNKKILHRNIDIGLDNNSVMPWLVNSGSQDRQPLAAPQKPQNLSLRISAGFRTDAWDRMLDMAGLGRNSDLEPSRDMRAVMNALENDIRRELGTDATAP